MQLLKLHKKLKNDYYREIRPYFFKGIYWNSNQRPSYNCKPEIKWSKDIAKVDIIPMLNVNLLQLNILKKHNISIFFYK